ncbi:hypothetical protein CDAR_170381 [Caerostris darwini]|uniref:Uncharacterized protein n=1 Tax=Caerostris darwini TaxID=1538125 RepID=A0AAV4R4A9_9ARAC|nr:hypothetical protein CDAR_170381 [Caerostris darwini]
MASEGFVDEYAFRITDKKIVLSVFNTVYIFVVGDEATGKTCLIRAFMNIRIKDPIPPSFEYVYTYTHRIMSEPLELRIVELRPEDLSLKEIRTLCRHLKHEASFVLLPIQE